MKGILSLEIVKNIYLEPQGDLCCGRSTRQNKALFNQNNGHLGSRHVYIHIYIYMYISYIKNISTYSICIDIFD